MCTVKRASKEIYDSKYSELGACQCLWFNKNIRSKSKQYFYCNEWCDKGRASNSPALRGSLPPGPYFSRSPAKHVKSPASMKKSRQACKISRINRKKTFKNSNLEREHGEALRYYCISSFLVQ